MDNEERPFIEVGSCEWKELVLKRVGNSNSRLLITMVAIICLHYQLYIY